MSPIESQYNLISREFSELVRQQMGLPLSGDILDVIDGLTTLVKEKLLIVLDEFQYIVNADKSFISRLQRFIDTSWRNKNLMIILCGSAVSFFEKELLGYKNPIFGRRTASLKIKALNLSQIKGFFPSYNIHELITTYGIVGGTPGYLEKLEPSKTVEENIKSIINPSSYLYDEASNLLKQEVREPKVYFSILAVIGEGRTSASEMASVVRVDPRSITKYIDLLEGLDIVKRVTPLGYKRPVKLYIKDNYFRFWFTYTYKLRSLLEANFVDEALSYIMKTLDNYLSYIFEDIVKELVPLFYKNKVIPTKPVQVGKWWHKDIEIDAIVREPGSSITFIEVKWQEINIRTASNILKTLVEKTSKSGLVSAINHYLLICKHISDAETPLKLDGHRTVVDLNYIAKLLGVQPYKK